jgi:hypothetical protein
MVGMKCKHLGKLAGNIRLPRADDLLFVNGAVAAATGNAQNKKSKKWHYFHSCVEAA